MLRNGYIDDVVPRGKVTRRRYLLRGFQFFGVLADLGLNSSVFGARGNRPSIPCLVIDWFTGRVVIKQLDTVARSAEPQPER
jgi:hypothetical protein